MIRRMVRILGNVLLAATAAELLFAGFILGRYADQAMPTYYVLRPLAIAALLALVVGAANWAFFRSAAPVAAVTVAGVIAFWSSLPPWGWLLVLVGAVVVVIAVFVRARGLVFPITSGLSRIALVLVTAFFAIGLIRATGTALASVAPERVAGGEAEGPNLYVLLLDGYPRADSLRNEFDIDQAPFKSDLSARGFDVYEDAETDRIWTDVTLLGMLEGTVDGVPVDVAEPEDRRAIRQRLADASLPRLARSSGYEWVVIDSPAGHVTFEGGRHIQHGGLNTYEERLLGESLLGPVIAAWWPSLPMDSLRQHLDGSLGSLIAEAEPDSHRLVFAHLFAPHMPVLWTAAGDPMPAPSFWPRVQLFESQAHITGLSLAEFSEGLRSQIGGLNARLIETIDAIVARDPDAVIVMFGDHGARYDTTLMQTEWRHALLAARTPGHPQLFAGGPSPTNVLRGILDAYVTP